MAAVQSRPIAEWIYVRSQASAIRLITIHKPQSPGGFKRIGSCRFILRASFANQYVVEQLPEGHLYTRFAHRVRAGALHRQ